MLCYTGVVGDRDGVYGEWAFLETAATTPAVRRAPRSAIHAAVGHVLMLPLTNHLIRVVVEGEVVMMDLGPGVEIDQEEIRVILDISKVLRYL